MTATAPRPVRPAVIAALGACTLVSLVAVLLALLGRTLVPFAVHGTVVSIDERNRDPGTEVWIVNTGDGTRWFTDDAAAAAFRPGVASKDAWSTRVQVGGTERSIGLTRDLLGPGSWAVLTTGGIAVVLWRRSRQGVSSTSSQLKTSRSPTRDATRPA
jgi:hypothetical protein